MTLRKLFPWAFATAVVNLLAVLFSRKKKDPMQPLMPDNSQPFN